MVPLSFGSVQSDRRATTSHTFFLKLQALGTREFRHAVFVYYRASMLHYCVGIIKRNYLARVSCKHLERVAEISIVNSASVLLSLYGYLPR